MWEHNKPPLDVTRRTLGTSRPGIRGWGAGLAAVWSDAASCAELLAPCPPARPPAAALAPRPRPRLRHPPRPRHPGGVSADTQQPGDSVISTARILS